MKVKINWKVIFAPIIALIKFIKRMNIKNAFIDTILTISILLWELALPIYISIYFNLAFGYMFMFSICWLLFWLWFIINVEVYDKGENKIW